MVRKKGDGWTHLEDSIIKEYIAKYNSLNGREITEKIESVRPEGIKTMRYEGKSLYQHVLILR